MARPIAPRNISDTRGHGVREGREQVSQSVSFDRAAGRYDDTRGYPSGVAERIGQELLRVGRVPLRGSVLEIGIGTGRISLPLLAAGVNVSGVDISPRMLDRLRAKAEAARAADPTRPWGTLDVREGDMTALPFADASFDAVVAVHVFHLVGDWRRALDEALRVVRPGGALLVGQDVHAADDNYARIQDRWVEFVREQGANPQRFGAVGYNAVLEEVRARGLPAEEHSVATWQVQHTPEQIVRYIGERIWSRTWDVPDDIFAESVRRLEEWTRAEFGAAYDEPRSIAFSFKLARIARR